MRVSCFCGVTFEVTEDLGTCPLCGEPYSLPQVSQLDADAMLVELQIILNQHGVAGA